MNRTYFDDNYGHYNIENEEDVEFYHQTQARSVRKKCSGCGRMVKIKPEYGYCNSCADKIERGGDF
jgi:rRNA maturation endonuclease Nob1